MTTADANRVIFTGENHFIRLSPNDNDDYTTIASFWRITLSGGGPGHVLYLKSELTANAWRIYSDNLSAARWLQATVQGMLVPDLKDTTIPVIEATFARKGDATFFWTEHIVSRNDEVLLTWNQLGDPLLIHTQPSAPPGRPYGMCSVLLPALEARLSLNGTEPAGRPWARIREGRPFSTCALAFSESWTDTKSQ